MSYSNRFFFWSKIAKMVRAGCESTQAFTKLSTTMVRTCQSQIIQAMRKERKSENWYSAFTKTEKGCDRFTYSNRLVLWSKIAEMVRAGWQSTQAINKVLNHYGTNLSVSKIIQAMRKDRNSDDGYPAELSQIPT